MRGERSDADLVWHKLDSLFQVRERPELFPLAKEDCADGFVSLPEERTDPDRLEKG